MATPHHTCLKSTPFTFIQQPLNRDCLTSAGITVSCPTEARDFSRTGEFAVGIVGRITLEFAVNGSPWCTHIFGDWGPLRILKGTGTCHVRKSHRFHHPFLLGALSCLRASLGQNMEGRPAGSVNKRLPMPHRGVVKEMKEVLAKGAIRTARTSGKTVSYCLLIVLLSKEAPVGVLCSSGARRKCQRTANILETEHNFRHLRMSSFL